MLLLLMMTMTMVALIMTSVETAYNWLAANGISRQLMRH